MRSTRPAVIAHHVQLAMHLGGLTMDAYAADVARLYEERTPRHERALKFHELERGGDAYAMLRANAQIVRRHLAPPGADGNIRCAAELEEALVLALPEPYQRECLRELAERYGMLCVRLPAPTSDGSEHMRRTADLFVETGNAVRAIAPMLVDGCITEADRPLAEMARGELRDVIGAAETLIAQIDAIDAPAGGAPSWSPRRAATG